MARSEKTRAKGKASFAERVRRHVAAACPGYRFVSTGGGSGPLVTFARTAPAKMPRLHEQIVFQKGLHGADWFRVNFFPSFDGDGANGAMEHALYEGATLGPDAHWKTDGELDAALAEACARLEGEVSRFFAAAEGRYAALEALFSDLVGHYARFLQADGAELAPADFVDDDGNPPKIPAFDAFVRFLTKSKLAFADPKLDLETPLWRFWHGGRPMRQSDFRKDDYYDCSRCGAFVSFKRGKLVARKIAGFGTHHAFVCGKH